MIMRKFSCFANGCLQFLSLGVFFIPPNINLGIVLFFSQENYKNMHIII